VLIGLPGKSDRPGYQRLYLTTKLNYYAEFLVSGILSAETIPADKSPFPGHEATQVTIGRDANIQYISAKSPQPVDEFDLDVRLGAQTAAAAPKAGETRVNGCEPTGHTCVTCHLDTQCRQATCHTCPGQLTCQACPGQAGLLAAGGTQWGVTYCGSCDCPPPPETRAGHGGCTM
jgi:hypothetical protein